MEKQKAESRERKAVGLALLISALCFPCFCFAVLPPLPKAESGKQKAVAHKGAFTPFVVLKNPPGSIAAAPQTALSKRAKAGGDYDVFQFEFLVDFIPNMVGVVISTNAKDWQLWDWRDVQVGEWNRGEIIMGDLPATLYVRVCGSQYGEWWDFPVRLRRWP